MRKTKIICTIGPASQSPEKIREMIEAGMNVCRCNFSHGSYEEQKNKMMTVVRISEEMKKPVATLIDTKGPEIRLRTFEEEKITLEEGQQVNAGEVVGKVAEPTIFYSVEGSNVYFQLLKDGAPVDPEEILP